MIKAIFFDVDGTLLSKKNPRLTPQLKVAFDTLRRKGILLFIATGRHTCELQDLKILEDYNFDGYITLNGCYCYNEKGVIYKAIIEPNSVKKVIEVVEQRDIACALVEKDGLYINKVDAHVIAAQEAIHSPIPEIKDLKGALHQDIYQIIPFAPKEDIASLLAVAQDCSITRWHPLAYDIVPTSGGKCTGIQKVLSYYNIQQEETMAFGDGHNDIDMLKFVNVGVCMGNGEEETKEVSDFVTKLADEDGILYALDHYQLLT